MTATGRTVQGSNSVTGKRSLHKGVYRVAGGVSWRVRLRTRIHLVLTLRMCGAIPPLPTFFHGVRMDFEGGTSYRIVELASLEFKSVLRHCYHDKQMKHGGSG